MANSSTEFQALSTLGTPPYHPAWTPISVGGRSFYRTSRGVDNRGQPYCICCVADRSPSLFPCSSRSSCYNWTTDSPAAVIGLRILQLLEWTIRPDCCSLVSRLGRGMGMRSREDRRRNDVGGQLSRSRSLAGRGREQNGWPWLRLKSVNLLTVSTCFDSQLGRLMAIVDDRLLTKFVLFWTWSFSSLVFLHRQVVVIQSLKPRRSCGVGWVFERIVCSFLYMFFKFFYLLMKRAISE